MRGDPEEWNTGPEYPAISNAEFDALFTEIEKCLSRHGRVGQLGDIDYLVVDDIYDRTQKIEVYNVDTLSEDLVIELQTVVKRVNPLWRILMVAGVRMPRHVLWIYPHSISVQSRPRSKAKSVSDVLEIWQREHEVEALLQALDDKDPEVRAHASQAFTYLDPDKMTIPLAQELVQFLRKGVKDALVRMHIIEALGRIGSQARVAVPELVAALGDKKVYIRWEALKALGRIGKQAEGALPALIRVLNSRRDVHERTLAIKAIGQVGSAVHPVIPTLCRFLRHTNPWLRSAAAEALGCMGPPAKSSIPALNKCLTDAEEQVRKAASEAIGNM